MQLLYWHHTSGTSRILGVFKKEMAADWQEGSFETTKNLRSLCKEGQLEEILQYFNAIQFQGIQASLSDYVRMLQKCINMKDLAAGMQVHAHIITNNVQDTLLVRPLLNMYATCGSMDDAFRLFDNAHSGDSIVWTNMISVYAKNGYANEALKLFWKMGLQGVKIDQVTFSSVLKVCTSLGSLRLGKLIHGSIIDAGLEVSVFLGSGLIDMYAKCGSLLDAHVVFEITPNRNVVSWSSMIAGYIQHRQFDLALKLFWQMESEGVEPNEVTFICILKGCTNLADIEQGRRIHALVRKDGYDKDVFLASTLIDMYAKCGAIVDASKVFDIMPVHNVVSWSAMVAGYAESGLAEEALKLFQRMRVEGMKPDQVTFVSILKACSKKADLEEGKRIHAFISEVGVESDAFVGSALVDMYAKCGSVENAREVFNKMQEQDVVSWSAMIACLVQCGFEHEALKLFQQMEFESVKPDSFTFVSILNACASLAALDKGKWIHFLILKNGLESDDFVATSLVDMYAKCGDTAAAEKVFNKLTRQNTASWNAMIAGYVQNDCAAEAIILFQQMQVEIMKPTAITYVSILKACSTVMSVEKGKQVHVYILGSGLEWEISLVNGLVDMYAKCGKLSMAQEVFDEMPDRNVVSWNVMIAGYVQHGYAENAFKLFYLMGKNCGTLDDATFVIIFNLCASLTSLDQGHHIHVAMIQSGANYGVLVYNCLTDMYSKSGSIEDARQVFDKMPQRNISSWNTMIAGYGQHGQAEEVLKLLRDMQLKEIQPNHITFVSVLSACSHGGLMHEGLFYFDSMRREHLIIPTQEHYACIVDLLGRAAPGGCKEKALQPVSAVWKLFVSACKLFST